MSILRADSIRDRAGTGAPDFPNGLTGNVTGTASTATVATNAQGITGTPNITVGTVGCGNVTSSGNISATDATFSGNLTVNGTTTTIDTAVTSVDSLSVDGAIAFANGKANGLSNADGVDLRLRSDTTNDQVFAIYKNGAGSGNRTAFINSDGSSAFSGTAIFKGGLAAKINIKTQFTNSASCAITDGNVIYTTSAEPVANTYPNITGVHSILSTGEGFSITVVMTTDGTGKINAFYIDGVQQTLIWSGGSAPSAAGASGKDVYTFSALKTGTGTTDYVVLGAVTNYA